MQALLELEMNSDLKAQLRELHITAAKVPFTFGISVLPFLCGNIKCRRLNT